MKTGVMKAEPRGFYGDLASAYDAERIDIAAIRLKLNGGVFSKNRELILDAYVEAERLAKETLQAGTNVVYDGLLNALQKREKIRSEVVDLVGAGAVLLCMYTPMWVVESRIRSGYSNDGLATPIKNQAAPVGEMIRVARSLAHSIEWPQDDERPLRLDGRLSSAVLLQQIETHIQQGAATEQIV